ncbi:hypothetical protein [Brevundimonas sp.]|uniref:hypothetical protein n=1 Tax=Brevundimonas sp. TaxID=1871086 RepID=UPI0025EAE491|nr:hypothetical protein [Brevundimonas sp.]
MFVETCEERARDCEARAKADPGQREMWLKMAEDWRRAALNPAANDPQLPPEA